MNPFKTNEQKSFAYGHSPFFRNNYITKFSLCTYRKRGFTIPCGKKGEKTFDTYFYFSSMISLTVRKKRSHERRSNASSGECISFMLGPIEIISISGKFELMIPHSRPAWIILAVAHFPKSLSLDILKSIYFLLP